MANTSRKNINNGTFESLTWRYVNCEYDFKITYPYFNHAEAKDPTLSRKGVRG